MSKLIVLIFLWHLHSFVALSQDELKTGLVRPTPEQLRANTIYGASLKGLNRAAVKHKMDLSKYLPLIENQGIQESCAAFSVASAVSILINEKNGKEFLNNAKIVPSKDDYENFYSPAFIFNTAKVKYPPKIRSDCQYGITYIDALNVAQNQGNVSWDAFHYKASVDGCTDDPTPYTANANKYKIYIYEPINPSSALFTQILSQDFAVPICIGTIIDQNYRNAGERTTNNSPVWMKKGEPLPQVNAYHAMLIVGFNDSARLFKVLDSRGPTWGDNGFIWMSYDLIDKDGRIDAAYIPMLDNKLLGETEGKTEGSADTKSKDITVGSWKWRLGINRYTVLDGVRVILVTTNIDNDKTQTYNFQFKNDSTGEILGDQLTYNVQEDKILSVTFLGYAFSIQPYKFRRLTKVGYLYIQARKLDQ